MFWDLLSLPKEHQVSKHLTVTDFLNKANLTDFESHELARMLSDIQLKYDFYFRDNSELIVMDVSIKYKMNIWSLKSIARIVAKSIPYNCMIYVHDNFYGSISIFDRRENSFNNRRSVIKKQSVFPEFSFHNINLETLICLRGIFENIPSSETSDEAVESIIDRIEEYKNYNRAFGESLKETWIESQKIFYLLQEGIESPYQDDFYEDIKDAEGTENDDIDIVLSFSEEALCKSVYRLFCEYCSNNGYIPYDADDNESIEWLLEYAFACNTIIYDLYNEYPKDSFYYNLGIAFKRGDNIAVGEFEDDLAVQQMRELIMHDCSNEETDYDA